MKTISEDVDVKVEKNLLKGILTVPENATGIVLFAHGSGSSRLSPRNQYVAKVLNQANLATLLMDLLTQEEENVDEYTRELRFDIGLLTKRLIGAVEWVKGHSATKNLKIGLFGSSTGAAGALAAAAQLPKDISAVVSRGGRPDLTGKDLPKVQAPTLLIVGGWDHVVIQLNEEAFALLECEKKFEIVPDATHLFEEHGKLEQAAGLASNWFARHLGK